MKSWLSIGKSFNTSLINTNHCNDEPPEEQNKVSIAEEQLQTKKMEKLTSIVETILFDHDANYTQLANSKNFRNDLLKIDIEDEGKIKEFIEQTLANQNYFTTSTIAQYHDLESIIIDSHSLPFCVNRIPKRENYLYSAIKEKDIPQYRRITVPIILGLNQPIIEAQLHKEINEMIGVYTNKQVQPLWKQRYFNAEIKAVSKSDTALKNYDTTIMSEWEKEHIAKVKEFNKLIEQEPENANNWKNYIKYQSQNVQGNPYAVHILPECRKQDYNTQ